MAAAGLHRLCGGEMPGEFVCGKEVLVIAIAASDKGACAGDGFPKKMGRRVILRFAGQLIESLKADNFRNLRVGVQAIQGISALRKRCEDCLMTKTFR